MSGAWAIAAVGLYAAVLVSARMNPRRPDLGDAGDREEAALAAQAGHQQAVAEADAQRRAQQALARSHELQCQAYMARSSGQTWGDIARAQGCTPAEAWGRAYNAHRRLGLPWPTTWTR